MGLAIGFSNGVVHSFAISGQSSVGAGSIYVSEFSQFTQGDTEPTAFLTLAIAEAFAQALVTAGVFDNEYTAVTIIEDPYPTVAGTIPATS